MDLSIIIVNWNSAGYLRKCLTSIYANTKGLSFEVVVVDNASYDGCGEMLAREFPRVRFIQSTENLGFARANNLGFEQSTGRNVLFLNPDAEPLGSALERLVSALNSDPRAGIVGPRLLNSDLSIQTSCIQRFPTILNQLLDSDFLRTKFPRARLWGTRPLWESSDAPVEVEVVSGACLCVKRKVFESVGTFGSRYFMYAEDVDLCYEVKRLGWKVCYVGEAVVVHHGGRSSSSKPESHYASVMIRQSVLTFLRAKRGRFYALLYRVTMAMAALARCAVAGVGLVLALTSTKRAGRVITFTKWLKVFRWAIGLEGWAEKLGPTKPTAPSSRAPASSKAEPSGAPANPSA